MNLARKTAEEFALDNTSGIQSYEFNCYDLPEESLRKSLGTFSDFAFKTLYSYYKLRASFFVVIIPH